MALSFINSQEHWGRSQRHQRPIQGTGFPRRVTGEGVELGHLFAQSQRYEEECLLKLLLYGHRKEVTEG